MLSFKTLKIFCDIKYIQCCQIFALKNMHKVLNFVIKNYKKEKDN